MIQGVRLSAFQDKGPSRNPNSVKTWQLKSDSSKHT